MTEGNRIRRVRSSPSVGMTVRSIAINPRKRADTSRQIATDTTQGVLGGNTPLTPPYDPDALVGMLDKSNMLRQCIEAYVTNIAMYGWEVAPIAEGAEIDDAEKEELQSLIDSPNCDESLTLLHARVVRGYEGMGYAFAEVIRDRKKRPTILRGVRGSTMRLCPRDPELVAVSYDVARGTRVSYITEYRRFRIYRQQTGGQYVYFKEFGDPRPLNRITGRFATKAEPVTPDNEATELIHFRQDSEDEYGVPRWIAQIPSVMGSREAEEVNLRYFEDNTVPPMILTVAGGRLTGQSFRELKATLNAKAVGRERQHQIMLIEAVPEREGLDDKGTVQVKIDKLTDSRQSDGLFKEYDESNQAKIRSAFRLPPVAVGLSQDVTFATANVSAFIAETQVYTPERTVHAEAYNKRFVNHPLGLGLRTVKLRPKTPSITNPELLIKSLTALNVMGAVTPRSAIDTANKVLQVALPQYPEKGQPDYEDWMDKPIIFSNKGQSGNTGIDPAKQGNTHEGQAIKDAAVKDLEGEGDIAPSSPENGQQ